MFSLCSLTFISFPCLGMLLLTITLRLFCVSYVIVLPWLGFSILFFLFLFPHLFSFSFSWVYRFRLGYLSFLSTGVVSYVVFLFWFWLFHPCVCFFFVPSSFLSVLCYTYPWLGCLSFLCPLPGVVWQFDPFLCPFRLLAYSKIISVHWCTTVGVSHRLIFLMSFFCPDQAIRSCSFFFCSVVFHLSPYCSVLFARLFSFFLLLHTFIFFYS